MPTLQRRELRRSLGTRRLRDTVFGTTTFSPNIGVGSAITIMDIGRALPDFSGQDLFGRAFLRVGSTDYRVGTFNVASGAWLSQTRAVSAFASGEAYEVNERLSADEMDDAIDETIATMRVRQEVGIDSIDGAWFYDIDGAASPSTIINHIAAGYYANPTSSLNRDFRPFLQHDIKTTGSGLELRMPGALGASVQIVLDALLQVTLSAADTATVNLPDQEMILWGAAARCYDLLAARSPKQEAEAFRARRREAVLQFNHLAKQHFPEVSKPLEFTQPFEPLE